MKNYTEIDQERHPSLKKDNKYLILTVVLIVFHLISNLVWIYLNNAPPNWDPSVHIIMTIEHGQYLFNNLLSFNLIDFLRISNYYPNFVYIFNFPLFLLSKLNYKLIFLSGSIFFSLAIFFLHFFASSLFNSKKMGFFTALIFSFFITIYQSSREFMLDLPLTALILMSVFFLFQFRKQKEIKYWYLFILSFSASQLTKWYAFIYLIVPLFYVVISLHKENRIRKKLIFHVMLSTCLLITLVGPWYFINYKTLFNQASFSWIGEKISQPEALTLNGFFFHLKQIIIFQSGFFGFLFFTLSIIALFLNRFKNKWELIVSIIFIYVFFTFIPNRNIRYLIPLMPFWAMIMAYGLSKLLSSKNTFGVFFGSFFLIYYLISYSILSFGFPVYPSYKKVVNFPIIGWVDIYYLADYPVKIIYDSNKWPQREIIDDVKEGRIFLDVDRYYINSDNFRLESILMNAKNIYFSSYNLSLLNIQTEQDMDSYLEQFDYALIPKKRVIGEDINFISYDPLLRFQEFFLTGKARNYVFVKKYVLPRSQSLIDDSDVLYLYRRIY